MGDRRTWIATAVRSQISSGGRLRVLVLAVGLALAAAGCSGGSADRTPTPSTNISQTNPSVTASPSATNTPAPTLTPVGTANAQAGAGDICDQPKNVSAQPPASIPGYPGAELHVSLLNNGSGLFGYCSSAQIDAVTSFYTQQLPGKGWTSVESHPLGDYQQVTGSQGNTQLTITISPDATKSGVVDILIIAQGL
jgi:hypothetical protein